MQKITTFLWFNDNAEEAVKFYTSIFKNSKITRISYYPESVAKHSGQRAGSVMTIAFKLHGQEFVAMNGGPQVKFNQSVSLLVYCNTQAELDRYWKKLASGGGEEVACGWLKDKFGLSWQIIPRRLMEYQGSADRAAAERANQAMLKMRKIVIADLEAAYAGK